MAISQDSLSRLADSIMSVNSHVYNTTLLSDEALVDECMAIRDTDDDLVVDICVAYMGTGRLLKKSRKYLCQYYIIYYSTPAGEEIC